MSQDMDSSFPRMPQGGTMGGTMGGIMRGTMGESRDQEPGTGVSRLGLFFGGPQYCSEAPMEDSWD